MPEQNHTADPLTPNQRAWVNALRSGEYQQAQFQLKFDGGFCCLGVLCDIAVKAGALDEYDENDSFPPPAARMWADLQTENGSFGSVMAESSLTFVNDDGMTFAEIADLIEKHHDTLFVKPERAS